MFRSLLIERISCSMHSRQKSEDTGSMSHLLPRLHPILQNKDIELGS